MSQLITIKLSGSLAQRFGRSHVRYLESGTAREAFSAIKNTLEGFEAFIREQSKAGIRYAVFRNSTNVPESEFDLAGTREIRIVPVLEGSKRGGVLQTILGAVLVVVGVVLTAWGYGVVGKPMVQAGIAMMAGGIIQMLSPQGKGIKTREDTENMPSYAFGGPVNTTAAGNPVGIGYGRRRIGGAIISGGIYNEDEPLPVRPTTGGGGGGGGGGTSGGETVNQN